MEDEYFEEEEEEMEQEVQQVVLEQENIKPKKSYRSTRKRKSSKVKKKKKPVRIDKVLEEDNFNNNNNILPNFKFTIGKSATKRRSSSVKSDVSNTSSQKSTRKPRSEMNNYANLGKTHNGRKYARHGIFLPKHWVHFKPGKHKTLIFLCLDNLILW